MKPRCELILFKNGNERQELLQKTNIKEMTANSPTIKNTLKKGTILYWLGVIRSISMITTDA